MVRAMVLGNIIMSTAMALCSCATPTSGRPVSICEFFDQNLNQDGSSTRIRATYSTDGMQVAFFRDASCPQYDIRIRFEGDDRSIRDFRDRVSRRAGPGNALQRYDLDVSGTYWDQYESIEHAVVVTKVNSFQETD
jgi:hypothetical protein